MLLTSALNNVNPSAAGDEQIVIRRIHRTHRYPSHQSVDAVDSSKSGPALDSLNYFTLITFTFLT